MMSWLRLFLLATLLLSGAAFSSAQDTLLFLNGRQLIADSIRNDGFEATVHLKDCKRPKKIDNYRIFSIRHADGNEEVIFRKDPTDPMDFTEEQMRMFIIGEQDAERFYHPKFSTGLSVAVGAASTYFAFYGLLVPPLYSTVIGSFTPNMERMKVSDDTLRSNEVYCEGYQSKVRRKKIKNSLLGGFAGFVAGFIAFNLVQH